MTRPSACANSEQPITGALLCAVCWRYKVRPRCAQFREHGFRLVAKAGKKPFGVRYEVKA